MKKSDREFGEVIVVIVLVGFFALILNGNITMPQLHHFWYHWLPIEVLLIELALIFSMAPLILYIVRKVKKQARK